MLIANFFKVAYLDQIILIVPAVNLNADWINVSLLWVVLSIESNQNFTQDVAFGFRCLEIDLFISNWHSV